MVSKHLIAFLLSAIAILFASASRAQSNAASVSAKQNQVSIEKQSALKLDLSLYASSDLEKEASTTVNRSTTLELNATYDLNKDYTLGLLQELSQALAGAQDLTASNTVLSISKSAYKFDNQLSLAPKFKVYLPTNEEDRDSDSLQGAMAASLSLIKKTQVASLPTQLSLAAEALKNSHQFETTAASEANLSYRGRISAIAELNLSQKAKFILASYYQAGRTYQNALRSAFYLAQELDYEFSENFTGFLTHENGGDALRANGRSSNVSIIDDRASVVSLGFKTSY